MLILKKRHRKIKIIKEEDKIIDKTKMIEIEENKEIINHLRIKENNGEIIRINKDKKYNIYFNL